MPTGMAGWLKAETLTMLGKLHLRLKNYAKALECYREVTELQPQNVNGFVSLGFCFAALGHHRDAFDAYEHALQIRPNFTILNAHLSLALEKLGDTKIAAEYLERALRSGADMEYPNDAAYWHHQLGLMYCKLDDWEHAASSFRLALKARHSDIAQANLANALWHTGDKDGSIEAYKRATLIAPRSADGFYGLGWALLNLQRNAEAVGPLRKATELDPTHPTANYDLGLALCGVGDYADAIEILRKAAKLRPEHPETHYSLGCALAAQGNFADATESYREAVRLRPDYADAHFNIGVAHSELGQHDEGIEAYRTALGCDSMDAKAWGNLALSYSRQLMYSDALEAFKRICELQPDNEQGFHGVASSLSCLEHYDEAIPNFEHAIRLAPSFIPAYEGLGWTFAKLGKFSQALDSYRAAMSIAPDSAQLHSELSDVCEQMGEDEMARQLRTRAEELGASGVDPAIPNPKPTIHKEHVPRC